MSDSIPPKTKITHIIPLVYNSTITYPSVNKNSDLRKTVTHFFINKIIKWIKSYDEFKHLKNKNEFYNSNEAEKVVYSLIRKFVNKNKVNWYELRTKYYSDVKAYLKQVL